MGTRIELSTNEGVPLGEPYELRPGEGIVLPRVLGAPATIFNELRIIDEEGNGGYTWLSHCDPVEQVAGAFTLKAYLLQEGDIAETSLVYGISPKSPTYKAKITCTPNKE